MVNLIEEQKIFISTICKNTPTKKGPISFSSSILNKSGIAQCPMMFPVYLRNTLKLMKLGKIVM